MSIKPALSVIIPTLNAATTLPACLAALAPGAALIQEVIIVDGGSTDVTRELAPNAIWVTAPASRGGQLRAGAAAAKAPFLLFLHADTRLSPGWPEAIETALINPRTAYYFQFRLDSGVRAARILESIVAWRCRLLKLPYGDQGLLISTDLLNAIGGIPNLPLMEDVALAHRLAGRLRPLPAYALTSAARYEHDGWLSRPLKNASLLTLYALGVPPARLKRFYG
jgi:rSAM/selenodomain-associated transferase 2